MLDPIFVHIIGESHAQNIAPQTKIKILKEIGIFFSLRGYAKISHRNIIAL